MLGKLLKYEIPAVGRKLGPMYIAWLAASVLLGLTAGRIDGSSFLAVIPALVYFAVTVAVFVMAIVMIIERYYNSMFGNEAYFNQALPVTAGEHILSKGLTALVWTVLTMLAALLSGLIILLLAGGAEMLWDEETINLSNLWSTYSHDLMSPRVILIIIEFLIVSAFSMLKSIMAIYTAISIGHLMRDHVVIASIIAYIGVMIFESTIGNVIMSLGFITTQQIDLNTAFISNFATFQAMMGIAFVVTILLITVYFFICKFFMEKKLNLA